LRRNELLRRGHGATRCCVASFFWPRVRSGSKPAHLFNGRLSAFASCRHAAACRRRVRAPSGSIRHDEAQRPPQSQARAIRSIHRHQTAAPPSYPAPPNRPPLHTADPVEPTFNRRCDLNPNGEHRIRGTAANIIPSVRHSQIPIAPATLQPLLPRVPSLEAFGRRPPCARYRP
jgi:hypothetical protein